MLENYYSTKMSPDKKKLQNRFTKIRAKSGKISVITAIFAFAVILIAIAVISSVFSQNGAEDCDMTPAELESFTKRMVGSVMAELDYVDDKKLVFHYLDGFFVTDRSTGNIKYAIDISKLNIVPHQQGSSGIQVKIDKDGRYAYLSAYGPKKEIEDFDSYIVDIENGKVKKGTAKNDTVFFENYADTHTVYSDADGWYSDLCIIENGTGCYLTAKDALIGSVELITRNSDGSVDSEYVFGDLHISYEVRRINIISESVPDDFEIINENPIHFEANGKKVEELYQMLGFSANIPVKEDGNYDVFICSAKNDNEISRYAFIIDNYENKLISYFKLPSDKLEQDAIFLFRDKDELYLRTEEYLKNEFERVFSPYYDIRSLEISDWKSNGTEAEFNYKMTHLYYNRDPDKAEYIKKAKDEGNPQYERMYQDYLSLKEANFEFRVVTDDKGELLLYSNVSPVGTQWELTAIDDYVLAK